MLKCSLDMNSFTCKNSHGQNDQPQRQRHQENGITGGIQGTCGLVLHLNLFYSKTLKICHHFTWKGQAKAKNPKCTLHLSAQIIYAGFLHCSTFITSLKKTKKPRKGCGPKQSLALQLTFVRSVRSHEMEYFKYFMVVLKGLCHLMYRHVVALFSLRLTATRGLF